MSDTPVRRTFVNCPEHGRQPAYVYERRSQTRADGTPHPRVKRCKLDQKLASRAWYLYGGGREKVAASAARWRAENREKDRTQSRARARASARWSRPKRVATVALAWAILVSGGRSAGLPASKSVATRTDVRVQVPRPPDHSLKSKPNPFDPCRWSPFFCGYVGGVR